MSKSKKFSKPEKRKKRKKFLIVCEGACTEPNYFKGFPLDNDVIDIEGVGFNTDTLVEEAIRLRDESPNLYNQVWVVFDRDSFPDERFLKAIKMCDDNGIKFAVSNEAFEIWYMLHFNYYDTAMSRTQYGEKLTQLLKKKYEKNDKQIYSNLVPYQMQAIKLSKKLRKFQYEQSKGKNTFLMNPITTVYELVEELNLHSQIQAREKIQL